jgi:hypothetical protein
MPVRPITGWGSRRKKNVRVAQNSNVNGRKEEGMRMHIITKFVTNASA